MTSFAGRTGRKAACLLLAAACLLPPTGCSKSADKHERQVFAMDTVMLLTAYGKNGGGALAAAEAELLRLDAALDPEKADSEVGTLNSGGRVASDSDTGRLLRAGREVFESTGGAYDPTVYPLVRAWGFIDGRYRVPGDGETESLLERTGLNRIDLSGEAITLPDGMELAFGAAAKGYAAQRVSEILYERGVVSAIISLGGDVLTLGLKPDGSGWRVAVTDPRSPGSSLGTLDVGETAVVTSGVYRRFFERDGVLYHHIIDPRTGRPAESGLVSVTVVCQNGVMADALSTALFVLGEEGALEYRETHGGLELVLVTDDGRVVVTGGLRESFAPAGTDYEYIMLEDKG